MVQLVKVLAIQAWVPEFDLQHSHKQSSVVKCICNPSTGEAETGGALELTGQPAKFHQCVLGTSDEWLLRNT